MHTPIFQFGTSRFLQAHVDLFVAEAGAGPITMVETTGSSTSIARIAACNSGAAYEVIIRGLIKGQIVDRVQEVNSISRGFSARQDFAKLVSAFVAEAEYVVSNTGDQGFTVPNLAGYTSAHNGNSWQSFPELLVELLWQRYLHNARPVTMLPCELVSANGKALQTIILQLARQRGCEVDFCRWLNEQCLWMNSLVDRIVSEPLLPLGAVAEPYALWAIEQQQGFIPPLVHPQVEIVESLGLLEKNKLHILNLSHTLLAHKWRTDQRQADETVYQIMQDEGLFSWLNQVILDEVIPSFHDHKKQALEYWNLCIERFCNPFLQHQLADISQNHELKIERRIGALLVRQPNDNFPILQQLVNSKNNSQTQLQRG